MSPDIVAFVLSPWWALALAAATALAAWPLALVALDMMRWTR